MRRFSFALVISLVVTHSATAAPRRASLGDVLVRARVLALVRVVAEKEGVAEVDRVESVVGEVPARFSVVQPGPGRHALPSGAEVLLALETGADGRWIYRAEASSPAIVDPRHAPAALAFVRGWRRDAPLVPEVLASRWIALLDHPAPIARRAAVEALTRHAPVLFGRLREADIEALAAIVTRPGIDGDARLAALRVLDMLGGRRGADALARRFAALPATSSVQQLAVSLIGRYGNPATRSALERCAEESGPAVAARCRQLLGGGGTPRTP